MTTARWTRLEQIFSGAIERPAAARPAWLDTACGSDAALRHEVDALLAAHETASDFLEQPAALEVVMDDPVTAEATLAERDAAPLPSGTRLGPYRILAEIGRGGMGIVYLTEDERLGRHVALKALPRALAGDAGLRERLRREARAAATIAHPAVAVVYALEEIGDERFIASEYVRGHTLRSEIARGPLPPARALALARQIADGLQAAHEAGVVHRDLKPENVIVGHRDAVKVVDFGIAAIEDDGARLTRSGAAIGTPAYMAPEQLAGVGADGRADVYALGILLAEMVTGRHPMHTPSGDGLPSAIAVVVTRCLQVDPDARYASAHALIAALDEAAARLSADRGATVSSTARRTTPRWWWEFHQATAAIVYWLMVVPAWSARELMGGFVGRTFFLLTLAAVIVSANLRLHLWFTSRFYPAHLAWARARARRWIRAGDWAFAVLLPAGGLLLDERWSAIGVVLIAVGIGAAVAFLLIEPVTTRAAFGRTGTSSADPLPPE